MRKVKTWGIWADHAEKPLDRRSMGRGDEDNWSSAHVSPWERHHEDPDGYPGWYEVSSNFPPLTPHTHTYRVPLARRHTYKKPPQKEGTQADVLCSMLSVFLGLIRSSRFMRKSLLLMIFSQRIQ